MDVQIGVKTVKPKLDPSGWTEIALSQRKWDVLGTVVESSNSHGQIYRVKHEDGTMAWYEPNELCLV